MVYAVNHYTKWLLQVDTVCCVYNTGMFLCISPSLHKRVSSRKENASKRSKLTGPVSAPHSAHGPMRLLQENIFDPIISVATEVRSALGSLCNTFCIPK
jgi:hypothetical protein